MKLKDLKFLVYTNLREANLSFESGDLSDEFSFCYELDKGGKFKEMYKEITWKDDFDDFVLKVFLEYSYSAFFGKGF